MAVQKLMVLREGYLCMNPECTGRMHIIQIEHDVTPECEPRVDVTFMCSDCLEMREIDLDDITGDFVSSQDIHLGYDPKRGKLGRSPQR